MKSETVSLPREGFSVLLRGKLEPETATPAHEGFGHLLRHALHRYTGRLLLVGGVLVFVVVFLAPDIFKMIPAGSVGVMYRPLFGGTQTENVMSEGLHLVIPWNDITIYNIRVQEVRHEMHVLTKEGLTVQLHLSIRYHPEPEMVGMLHKRIGPEYVDKVVIPEVESAMRTIMAAFTVHDVYTSDPGLLQRVIDESLEGVSQEFVLVDDVVLRSVELPEKVEEAVEEKMKERQLVEAYEYRVERERLESNRKGLEAATIKKYNDVVNSSITPQLLKWKAIEATHDLAQSPNSKIIFIGGKQGDLPIMLGGEK
jgi:regulator of protease activity HflC (stomatin/prohibitin superfamily)